MIRHSDEQLLDMVDWYRVCLENVNEKRVVRGLDEAQHGYHTAMCELRRRSGEKREQEPSDG